MENDALAIWPNIILFGIFIVFLWARHSVKGFNWVNWLAIALGVALSAIVIVLILENPSFTSGLVQGLLILLTVIIFAFFVLFLTRVLTVEKLKKSWHFDERITAANVKSARNALMAVYLSAIIDLLVFPDFSKIMLIGILALSVVVYLASMLIYYYRSF
jgi:hypothetical protein